ncbi:MAG: phage holin family protein, partial [Limisphaerales bacterium]
MNADQPTPSLKPPLLRFLHRWLVTTLAVMVAAGVLPGIDFDNWKYLLTASLLLGILNALLRPLLLLISLPLVILSLGLYVIVINALLLSLVGQLVTGFHVNSFWDAFLGAILI